MDYINDIYKNIITESTTVVNEATSKNFYIETSEGSVLCKYNKWCESPEEKDVKWFGTYNSAKNYSKKNHFGGVAIKDYEIDKKDFKVDDDDDEEDFGEGGEGTTTDESVFDSGDVGHPNRNKLPFVKDIPKDLPSIKEDMTKQAFIDYHIEQIKSDFYDEELRPTDLNVIYRNILDDEDSKLYSISKQDIKDRLDDFIQGNK